MPCAGGAGAPPARGAAPRGGHLDERWRPGSVPGPSPQRPAGRRGGEALRLGGAPPPAPGRWDQAAG
ncbi:MAG: hypothetical protein DI601_06345 [Azospirillum brasilense]|nr:MAG: hypothetical protein DI601_06345 [Azospirillum brasilense]